MSYNMAADNFRRQYRSNEKHPDLNAILQEFYGRLVCNFEIEPNNPETIPIVHFDKIRERSNVPQVLYTLFDKNNATSIPSFLSHIKAPITRKWNAPKHPLNMIPIESSDTIRTLQYLQQEDFEIYESVIKSLAAEITKILHERLEELKRKGLKDEFIRDIQEAYERLIVLERYKSICDIES